MSEMLQHLLLVRHGEGEGDVRRAAWKRGEAIQTTKLPEEEEITELGAEQSHQAGLWIAKHVIERYGLSRFDGCYVSTAQRSEQSAVAMDLDIAAWQEDHRLDERNRGRIRGLQPQEHKQRFPASYRRMKEDPLNWIPPGGESILNVSESWRDFYEDIRDFNSVIVVGHRDQMWAAMQPLERLSDEELLAVNTDEIHNSQIIHYTSISPKTGEQAPTLRWKRSIDPMQPEISLGWQTLPNVTRELA